LTELSVKVVFEKRIQASDEHEIKEGNNVLKRWKTCFLSL
jgi:hypothetical protein